MANTDTPRGFYNVKCRGGGSPSIGAYVGSTVAIYPGDALQWSSGKVIPLVDAQVDVCGVAVTYHDGTDGGTVYMYDNLDDCTFEVQTDDASFTTGLAQTNVGVAYDVKVTTGDTVRFTSKHEMMNSSDDAQIQVIEIVNAPDNDTDAIYAKCRVKFVKTTHAAAHAAIA